MPILKNWKIVYDLFADCHRIEGNVHNDSRFPDGTKVSTSKLIRVDFEAKTAETRNTVYSLEETC